MGKRGGSRMGFEEKPASTFLLPINNAEKGSGAVSTENSGIWKKYKGRCQSDYAKTSAGDRCCLEGNFLLVGIEK
jgi:hypothetical protein